MSIEYTSGAPLFELDVKELIGKSIVINGPTGSGKTNLVKEILNTFKGKVSKAFVVCPTNNSHHTYDAFTVPQLIYPSLAVTQSSNIDVFDSDKKPNAAQFIGRLKSHQEAVINIDRKVNNKAALNELYNLLSSRIRNQYKDVIDKIKKIRETNGKEYEEKIVAALRKIITRHRAEIKLPMKYEMEVPQKSEDPKIEKERKFTIKEVLENIIVIPDAIIIFDDVGGMYARYPDILSYFFEKARHIKLTTLYICQDEIQLPKGIRAQANYTVYTTRAAAETELGSKYITLSNSTRKKMIEYMGDVYSKKFTFIIYQRDDSTGKQVYQYSPKFITEGTKLCSPDVLAYCSRISK